MTFSHLEFSTVRYDESVRDGSRGWPRFFLDGSSDARRRTRQFDADEAAWIRAVLGARLRGATLPGDQGHGDQPAEPLRRLQQQGEPRRKALDRYQTGPQSFVAESLEKPTARAVVEALFAKFVRTQRDRSSSRGCMIVSGALACGKEAEPVRRRRARLRQATVAALRERFERAVYEDEGTDCLAVARYVATV